MDDKTQGFPFLYKKKRERETWMEEHIQRI